MKSKNELGQLGDYLKNSVIGKKFLFENDKSIEFKDGYLLINIHGITEEVPYITHELEK